MIFIYIISLQRNEWISTKYDAELRENLEAVKFMICLFTSGANKTMEPKNTIELTCLQKISLEMKSKLTVEKHRYDKYICIEVRPGCTTFLRFDTK